MYQPNMFSFFWRLLHCSESTAVAYDLPSLTELVEQVLNKWLTLNRLNQYLLMC